MPKKPKTVRRKKRSDPFLELRKKVIALELVVESWTQKTVEVEEKIESVRNKYSSAMIDQRNHWERVLLSQERRADTRVAEQQRVNSGLDDRIADLKEQLRIAKQERPERVVDLDGAAKMFDRAVWNRFTVLARFRHFYLVREKCPAPTKN